MSQKDRNNQELIHEADVVHSRISAGQRHLFSLILEIERTGAWQGSGARNLAHWLFMRYGISLWKAHRWIAAAHAMEELPLVAEAFASGQLGIDKVVELTGWPPPRPRVG